jgi:PKD repeat protein
MLKEINFGCNAYSINERTMKRKLLSTGLFVAFFGFSAFTQTVNSVIPKSFELQKTTPTLNLPTPNMEAIHQEDIQRDRNGQLYRIGVANFTNITTSNAGSWTIRENGDRVWQLHVKNPGAEALSFLFQTFKIYGQTTVDVFGLNGQRLHKTLTAADVQDHYQMNMALCFGDEMTVQIIETASSQPSEIQIDRIFYNYRSTGNPAPSKINESDACEVNVNCSPVGDSWQEEKRGVARVYVVEGSSAGWCSGNLVNNTALDCKPLFLTALHCGVTTSASDSNQWRFYFKYEAPTCTNPTSTGTLASNYITGCVRLANANDGGGTTGSDFLLVQLGTLANQATTVTTLKSAAFNAYWNGWDANNTAATGGVGIHHPAGDIKKISTFSGNTISSGWNGNGLQSHWRLTWTSNSNGYGVTEGGSSGSPLFNSAGRQIGTLTGGGSYCTAQTAQDYYGKVSYHWTSNGTPANEQLKTYLDPGNTGLLVLDGSANPCAVVTPTAPVANFVANPTTLSTGGTTQITDLSTNAPTAWSWSISPATGWSYAGGTTATSQNPQVTFTVNGTYSVTLTASNSIGSDQEIKTAYITVSSATAPCTATTTTCDEYIATVALGTINNATTCNNYTSYSQSTTLAKGSAYTATITTAILNNTTNNAYVDDECAVWIDYNGDLDFNDVGEQVGYAIATASAFNTAFNFTVPASAITGTVKMRVRVHYAGTDVGEGTVTPCGSFTYGEVEDYNVSIVVGTSGINEADLFETVNVYPNPVSETVSADLTGFVGENITIELIDMTGKVLNTQVNIGGTIAQFDMAHFAKGMYQVRISNGTVASTQRVIKL